MLHNLGVGIFLSCLMCNLINLFVKMLLLADMHGQSLNVLHVEPKWDGFLQPPTKN